jgi:uncharacterized protein (TIRG00374 family)
MTKKIKIVIGLIISISLIIYLFAKIDFKGVKEALLKFNPYVLIILFGIYILGMVLRSIRWQLLIKQREPINGILIFKALAIGYMINNLIPAKMGELARMEYIKQKNGTSRSFLLGTIFIERLLDVILVVAIFSFSLIFSQTSRQIFEHNRWIIYSLAGGIVISFFCMLNNQLFRGLVKFIPDNLKVSFIHFLSSFSDAVLFIKKRKLLAGVSFLSILIWGLTFISAYSTLWGLGVFLPIHAYLFVIAAGVLGVVIPSTSGGIGVYHAISTGALLLFGVLPEKALAYAIISHSFDFFPNIVTGGCVLLFDNFSKMDIRKA